MQTLDDKILKRVRGRGGGSMSLSLDFMDLGSRAAVDQALSRLAKDGVLRRVTDGMYSYPRWNALIGELSPEPEKVAKALARRGSQKLLPTGAYAANILGLSEQVPAKVEYLTDGPSRRVMIQRLEVVLKQTTPRNMATAGRITGTVIQALRFLRRSQVDDETIEKLTRRLSDAEKRQLLKDIALAPVWMGAIFRKVAAERN